NSYLYGGIGPCQPNELHEGTYAIIYDFVPNSGLFVHHGNPPPNTLTTANIQTGVGPAVTGATRYCFYLNGGGVTYAPQGAAANCSAVTGPAQTLNNPQVVVETVAYDRPPKAAGGQVVADLSRVQGAMVMGLTPQIMATVPQSTRAPTSSLRSSLLAGRTLSDSVMALGAAPVARANQTDTFAVSPNVHLALVNARAMARCEKIGVPTAKLTTLCTVSSLAAR
ncbi:MAG: hypothetical protein ACREP9_04630, partial [Candidatus Dormibacteraceae bacterium]